MYREENNGSISISDMFAYIIRHWKFALICMIVLSALVGGVKSYLENKENKRKYDDSTYAALESNLTESQLETVDQFYNRYQSYKKMISESWYYIDNSLLMKLDATNASVYSKEYIIKTPESGIIESFGKTVLDQDDYNNLASALGDGTDPKFLSEIITLKSEQKENKKSKDEKEDDSSDINTGTLSLTVKASDFDACEKIAGLVDSAIKDYLQNLIQSGIKVEMSELAGTYTESVDSELADAQKAKRAENSKLITEYYEFEDSAKNLMSSEEYALFRFKIDRGQDIKTSVNYKKWFVVGLLGGLVLALVILIARYLLIPGIKTAEDTYIITGEREMGIVAQPNRSKFFLEKFFRNWAMSVELHTVEQIPDSESILLICDRIERLCKEKEIKSLFFVSDSKDSYSEKVVSEFTKAIEEAGIFVGFGNPCASIEALKKLRESNAAVLAFTDKHSLSESIRSNICICEENSVPVIGNFIIHPQK